MEVDGPLRSESMFAVEVLGVCKSGSDERNALVRKEIRPDILRQQKWSAPRELYSPDGSASSD